MQTQVIPYLKELVKGGHEMSLLTFEPAEHVRERGEEGNEAIRKELAEASIEWHWLSYHKRPSVPATLYDVINGAREVRRLSKREGFDILHARGHVPAVMAALSRKMMGRRAKLLFDIRGFMPEEYTDAGVWREGGWIYRTAKRIERWLMRESDGFVVLTERAKKILFDAGEKRPVEVIPCCVDMKRFEAATPESRKAVREELSIGDRYVGVYVGAFGGWYLAEETAEFFGAMRRRDPDTFVLILTQSKREMIEPLLKAQGFAEDDYFIAMVPSAEIPRYLSAADLAVSFIKPCYSKRASSPTKNAEYLACGLPIMSNAGIGDVDALVIGKRVGVILNDFKPSAYADAFEKVRGLNISPEYCREIAMREFDLESVAGTRYRALYRAIRPLKYL